MRSGGETGGGAEIALFPTGLAAVKVSWNLPSFISASSCLAHLGSAVTYLEEVSGQSCPSLMFPASLPHLNQSTLVLGCVSMTYTEAEPGGRGLTRSGGQRMKGGG